MTMGIARQPPEEGRGANLLGRRGARGVPAMPRYCIGGGGSINIRLVSTQF